TRRSAVSGVELPRQENRGPTQDLVVLPQPPELGLQALDLGRLLAGHARTGSVVDLGLGQPAPHGLARDALLTGDCGHHGTHGGVLLGVLAHEPHAPRAQLGIGLLRHAVYPLGLKQQRHQTRDGSCVRLAERHSSPSTALVRKSASVPALLLPGSLYDRTRSEEHTSELQSRFDLVCRLLLEKKKKFRKTTQHNSSHNQNMTDCFLYQTE